MIGWTARRGFSGQAEAPIQMRVAIAALCIGAVLVIFLNRAGQAGPEQYGIFQRLFFFNDFVGACAMLLAFVLASLIPAFRSATIRLAGAIGTRPGLACALAFVALAAGARFVYLGHPLSMDEYVPVMQANAFAHGHIAAHYPVPLLDEMVWKSFRGTFILLDPKTGEAMSGYWPGLALLMTPFAAVRAAWALNAALTVLALALIGDFAARAGADPAGASRRRGWAMLAALSSPAFTVNAMSFYAMPGLLALNLLYLWLLLRPGHRYAFAAGLVGGLTLGLHNPLPHALMAAPCFVWMAIDRERRLRLPALVAGYVPLTALLCVGWPLLTSSMHLAGAITTTTHESAVAHWAQLIGRLFRLPSADTMEARQYATWKIWIWACPGLALAPFVVRPRDDAMKLLLAAAVLTYLAYFLVLYDQGHGWGYRYIHPVWGVFPIAGGLWFARAGAAQALGSVVVSAGLLATPVFLWETHETVAGFLARRIEAPQEGRWIVFIDTRWRYAQDLVQNPPGVDRVRYLISNGEERDRLLMTAQFPQAIEAVHDERGSAWRLPEPSGQEGTR